MGAASSKVRTFAVRIRNPKTRGEYFLPKIFLQAL
jgi:hypothetical protein